MQLVELDTNATVQRCLEHESFELVKRAKNLRAIVNQLYAEHHGKPVPVEAA